MNQSTELTLEQQFRLRSFTDQVQYMSREQAQEFVLILYQQMMLREAMYQQFLKGESKPDSGVVSK